MPGNAKPRRRKHRGTQTGSINRRGRTRPRNRQEAIAQARSRGSRKESGSRRAPVDRRDLPPTWRGAAIRGVFLAALLGGVFLLIGDQPVAGTITMTVFAALLYIPLGYFTERFFWRRRMARHARERDARSAEERKGR